MDPETWLYSKIIATPTVYGFSLKKEELPVFLIEGNNAKTLVTTRRIIEISGIERKEISIIDIDDIIYGDFKGRPNKPSMSIFRTIDLYGDELNFQLETGAASVGLITSLNTLINLISE
ncbi:hypothetical protein R1T16_12345 [Flavobacterium sp. DG1-102-2]|uniref:hypothetical protein n=1 Tax=Flavobacterium sp. DG1-102-2 TaxID=3081663 RepID=UPI00294A2815|nr:hypothetical protein [Flavobacterium sp. DG1-102-2]MDV6169217.1 hypothetical protein [Flavobacterium sp. DG1-102-2]